MDENTEFAKAEKHMKYLKDKWLQRSVDLMNEANDAHDLANKYMEASLKCNEVANSLRCLSDALLNDIEDYNSAVSLISKHKIYHYLSDIADKLNESSKETNENGVKAENLADNFQNLAKEYQEIQGKYIDDYNRLSNESITAARIAQQISSNNCYNGNYDVTWE